NGVVRQASIHSNCHSLSHDIAKSFQNYSALRYCLSGGKIQTESSKSNLAHNSQVQSILCNNPTIQNLFGLNTEILKDNFKYPFFNQPPQSSEVTKENVPLVIKNKSPHSIWMKIPSFKL
ncbi:hypothetical protein BY996DRAFT_4572576, partial [Phakopsora pachyrhizi]